MLRPSSPKPSCNDVVQCLLIPLLCECKEAFLVVDGLDLCSKEEYEKALKCFTSILEKSPVKVVICGRAELDVEHRLPDSMRLDVTATKNKDDIAVFIKHRVEERSTYDGPISNNASTVAEVVDTLISEANGMYVNTRLEFNIMPYLLSALGFFGRVYRLMSFGIRVALTSKLPWR